ncbi:MAG: hypothetical protein HQ483_17580 [Rhodospirillales bacterium]|nr:hypothetical protein [Rhodospirillales bacterium]
MVNTIQTGADWQPRFTTQALRQPMETEAFSLSPESPAEKDDEFSAFGADGFTLLDAIDIVNPLQHIPFVGTVYRELTGDTLDPFSRVAGSTLFFGPLGTAVSSANVALQEITGRDFGGHMMALLKSPATPTPETTIALDAGHQETPAASTKPTAAGTDSMDPVTAWALGEISYRNALAEAKGITPPVRSYTALVDNAAPALQTVVDAIVPPAKWSKPLPEEKPVFVPDQAPPQQVADSAIAAQPAFLPLNEFQAEHRASPATLLRLKQSTTAYKTIDFPRGKPVPASDRQTPATSPTVTDSQAPTPSMTAPALPSGALSADSNWFSASVIDALGKYKAVTASNPEGADPLTANSSLH